MEVWIAFIPLMLWQDYFSLPQDRRGWYHDGRDTWGLGQRPEQPDPKWHSAPLKLGLSGSLGLLREYRL